MSRNFEAPKPYQNGNVDETQAPPSTISISHIERIVNVGLIMFAVAALFLIWYRLRFGIDFTDEAFYVAMSYRFALGDRPFIDELSVGQTFALLTAPLTQLYLKVNAQPDGIFLYLRHLYLLFTCGIAGVVYYCLLRIVCWRSTLLISLNCVVFSFFFIPNFSYNTLGSGFFSLGLFFGLYAATRAVGLRGLLVSMVFSGICLGFAVVAYPSFLLPVAFYLLGIVPWTNSRKAWAFAACLFGILIVATAFAPFVIRAGNEMLSACWRYSNSLNVQGGGLSKLYEICGTLVLSWPRPIIFLSLLYLIAVTNIKRPFWCGLAIILLPLVLMPVQATTLTSSMLFLNYYSLLAPIVGILAWRDKPARQLLLNVWLPAFFAGVVTAWSSGNGFPNAAVGWFPAALVTTALLTLVLNELDNRDAQIKSKREMPLRQVGLTHLRLKHMRWMPALLVVMFLLQQNFRSGSVYRDNDIPELTRLVNSGPYRGMYTTPSKSAFLQAITRDIRRIVHEGDSILLYDLFPAGYLLTPAKPNAPILWMQPISDSPTINRRILVDYYQKHPRPDIVVQILRAPQSTSHTTQLTYPPNDVFNNFIRSGSYKTALEREEYRIMRKVTATQISQLR